MSIDFTRLPLSISHRLKDFGSGILDYEKQAPIGTLGTGVEQSFKQKSLLPLGSAIKGIGQQSITRMSASRPEDLALNFGPGGFAGTLEEKLAPDVFGGFKDLTTKVLEHLKGKSVVSKQFIYDLTNMPELKQAERDLIRNQLAEHGKEVNVKDFANKVKTELLPLKTRGGLKTTKYESISLPEELRGPIANYSERIYQSPIKTSAGGVHFSSSAVPDYFAHTRIEDLPALEQSKANWTFTPQGEGKYKAWNQDTGKTVDKVFNSHKEAVDYVKSLPDEAKTRRVIELQSDLFQKGRLELEGQEVKLKGYPVRREAVGKVAQDVTDLRKRGFAEEDIQKFLKEDEEAKKLFEQKDKELSKLEPYRNTWHERVIREEVKQAAKDGKSILQFPTGETAMKIEGLAQGEATRWGVLEEGRGRPTETFPRGERVSEGLTPQNMKVGQQVLGNGEKWIITDVLGDGKFKAMPKEHFDSFTESKGVQNLSGQDLISYAEHHATSNFWSSKETFDISGKVDTSDPIYRFYEKEVGRYLKNKYNAELITDPQGVKWWQVNVPKGAKRLPVEAFALTPLAIPALNKKNKK